CRRYFEKARGYIERDDPDAFIVPFVGREGKASPSDAGELRGANGIVKQTIGHYHVGHFCTANDNLVAAWIIK
ncbi:hypothetical protein AAVH_43766, partial [Aphelenchoides avenae]